MLKRLFHHRFWWVVKQYKALCTNIDKDEYNRKSKSRHFLQIVFEKDIQVAFNLNGKSFTLGQYCVSRIFWMAVKRGQMKAGHGVAKS